MGSADALLREYVRRGEELDLAAGTEIDWTDPGYWTADRSVGSETVRDLLRNAADLDPRGVRLRGARLVGTLDLEGISTGFILVLRDCDLPDGVGRQRHRVENARLPHGRTDAGETTGGFGAHTPGSEHGE